MVHDPFWTATARHADIVLPVTMSIERDDFGSGQNDRMFFPMPALTRPHGEARDDYAIFSDLAERRGAGKDFTEGRTAMEWLRHLYGEWRDSLASRGRGRASVPGFDEFWAGNGIELPVASEPQVAFAEFRSTRRSIRSPRRPGRSRSSPRPSTDTGTRTARATRSGLSRTSGSARRPRGASACSWSPISRGRDCTASWMSARTASRSRSPGVSRCGCTLPTRRYAGCATADLVRIFNDRGACLAGLSVDDAVRPGVVQLSTGAWYDPDPADPGFCRHGNPNVLTADLPSSSLSQGCTGQLALVEVEAYRGTPPELSVTRPPATA